MNLAVIAANGRLGQAFVTAALAAGHSVRAGMRGQSRLQPHPSLTVVTCDATDLAGLTELVRGQDAVVSAIGHVKGSPANVQTSATRVAVQVMEAAGITRFVDVTGTGVRFPGDIVPWYDRFMNYSITLIDEPRIADGRQHQEVLIKSRLDWTTIRVLKLQNTTPKPFSLREHGPAKLYVSRAETAAAMLTVLEQDSFIKQAPVVASP